MDAEMISFDAEKASRYLLHAIVSFTNDPCDSDFQRGFLSALLVVYREGLGKGIGDDRVALAAKQVEA